MNEHAQKKKINKELTTRKKKYFPQINRFLEKKINALNKVEWTPDVLLRYTISCIFNIFQIKNRN